MKNLSTHAMLLWCIALILCTALALIIPFTHTTVFWLAAISTLLMFALVALSFHRAFRRGGILESKLLGWPIFKTAVTALIVQVIVGFALMGLAGFCPVWGAVLVEVLVFAFALAVLTVRDASREAVTASEQAVADQTAAWKAIRQQAAAIAAASDHPELKKLAEDIRYADPTPTELDAQFAEMLTTLSSYADAENIRKAKDLLKQRNALAKSSK